MTAYVKELLFGTKSTPTKEESAADDEISGDEILSFGDGSEISEDGRESTNTINETCESDSDESVGQVMNLSTMHQFSDSYMKLM